MAPTIVRLSLEIIDNLSSKRERGIELRRQSYLHYSCPGAYEGPCVSHGTEIAFRLSQRTKLD